MSKGAYLAQTAGGTQTSNLPTNFGSVSSNQGGGPAGMTFGEAASVGTTDPITGGFQPSIMSQQEAQQAQQQINQNQPATTPQGESAEDIRKRLEEERLAALGDKEAGKVMQTLMNASEDGILALDKEKYFKTLPGGMHPLRKQYEYLAKKYGEGWKNTTQAKVLESYLSGVPVERGGGLGARSDKTDAELIGPTNVDDIPMYDPVTGKYRSLEERQALADAAQARLDALNQFGGIGGLDAAEGATSTEAFLRSLDPKQLRLGLSPDQYFRFRQQLMAADPTAENQLYKSTFPFSSGAGLETLTKFLPYSGIVKNVLGGLLPERDLTGYQQNIDPISVGFEPLPLPDPGSNPSGFFERKSNFADKYPDADFGIPTPVYPRYPLPGDPRRPPFRPPFMPGFPTGIETVFNLGPSFRGSPYTNRGVSPAFYQALTNFPGMA